MSDIVDKVITNIDDKYIEEAVADISCNDFASIKRQKSVWKKVVAFAAIISLLVMSMPIAASAGSYTAYQIIYSVNEGIAKRLTRVNESCEDNGIKMTVEGINIDENKADIYISMQDLTGDRIDETTDLFDSYSIHTTADQVAGCEMVSYDEDTKTATFLICVEQDEPIVGEKFTFSVSELLSGKEINACELDITDKLEATTDVVYTDTLPVRGGSGDEFGFEKSYPVLKTDMKDSFSPVLGVHVMGYGFIDNQLHIQAYYENIVEYDNHGFVYLTDIFGDMHPCVMDVAFWDEEEKGSYEDYVYDITEEEFKDYEVWGDFVTTTTNIKGDWSVSIWVENKK